MTPQLSQSLIARIHTQRTQSAVKTDNIAVLVPGKWPDGGKKRLDGKSGPLGECVAEYEDGVLCCFSAAEVMTYCAKFVPVLEIKEKP